MKRERGAALGPLRRVLGLVYEQIAAGESTAQVPRDLLECGHLLHSSSDIYGPTFPARRRCRHCRDGHPPHRDPPKS